MRTVLRFGTAMAITILVAAFAANCALPAYEAGESTSTSGGGGRGGASSGGQGGAVTVASSSKVTSSSSGSDIDAGDGSTCNPAEWGPCPVDTQCSCKTQHCYKGDCGNAANIIVQTCDGAHWVPAPAPTDKIVCCPVVPTEPCAPGAICVLTNVGGTFKPSCSSNSCISQNMADLCACKVKLCTDPLSPNCVMGGAGVVKCEP